MAVSKTFLGVVIFLIIAAGVLIFVTVDEYDNNNYIISSKVTGIYFVVAGLLWGLSLALYNRYGNDNVLVSVIWFEPLFRGMFRLISFLIILLIGK